MGETITILVEEETNPFSYLKVGGPPIGLDAARKLVHRFLVGSGSNRGIPVADVVVLHVLVDILLKIFGAIGRLPR